MKYEVLLQGDKKIVVSKVEADAITKGILARQDVFKIGENIFKRTAFKGMFPISEEVSDNKEKWLADNKEWHNTCEKMSKYPIDKKIEGELNNRILPGLKLNKITLPPQLLEPMKANIKHFLEQNPKYPRCPMRIWWPFIRAKIAPKIKGTDKRENPYIFMAHWWRIVLRNDEAIEEWLQYN